MKRKASAVWRGGLKDGKGSIATERHTDKGTLITGSLPARFAGVFERYAVR